MARILGGSLGLITVLIVAMKLILLDSGYQFVFFQIKKNYILVSGIKLKVGLSNTPFKK